MRGLTAAVAVALAASGSLWLGASWGLEEGRALGRAEGDELVMQKRLFQVCSEAHRVALERGLLESERRLPDCGPDPLPELAP